MVPAWRVRGEREARAWGARFLFIFCKNNSIDNNMIFEWIPFLFNFLYNFIQW